MLLRRHERQHPHMKQLHNSLPANRLEGRDPLISLNLGIPFLPTIGLTIGGSRSTSAAPSPTPTTPAPGPAPTTTQQPQQPQQPTQTQQPQPSATSPAATTGNSTPDPRPSNNPTPDPRPITSPADSTTGGSSSPSTTGQGSGPQPSSNPGDQTDTGGSDGEGETPSGSEGTSGGGRPGESTGGNTAIGGIHNGRPSPNNLGSSDFPENGGVDGTGNGGSSNSGGRSGGGNSGSPVGGDGFTTGRGGGTRTTTGADGSPTVIDDGGRPVETGATSAGFPRAAGIAIGIICALLFLIGLVILLRRRRKAKREERVHHWWFSKKRTSRSYNDDAQIAQLPPPASARSSFATNYDHSAQFEVNFGSNSPTMPALPPMAELRRSRNDLPYPIATSVESGNNNQRLSVGSANSRDSQYFIINHRPSMDTSNDHSTVSDHDPTGTSSLFRGPSQRFAFPKPPSDVSSDRKSGYSGSSSRPPSAHSAATNASEKTFRTPDTSPTPPEHQNLPAFADNPFADPQAYAHTLQASTSAPAPQSTESHTTATTDPFSDSTVSTAHGVGASPEETLPIPVLRPFTSTLHDEVTLRPGDEVKVLQIFDDGWALVDKLDVGSAVAIQRGLCPLACLR